MSTAAVVIGLMISAPWPGSSASEPLVHGAVYDGANPAAGVAVGVLPASKGLFDLRRLALTAEGRTTTDPSGHFDLRSSPGRVAVVAIQAGEDVRVRSAVLTDANSFTTVRLSLDGLEIEGTALDASGQPLHRIRVTAFPDPGERGALTGNASAARAWTNPDGTFRLRGLTPGRYRLTANGGRYWLADDSGVVANAGERGVVLHLAPSPSIRGRVVRRDVDGRVIPVQVFGISSQMLASRSFDIEDGTFELATRRPPGPLPMLLLTSGLPARVLRVVTTVDPLDLGTIELNTGRSVSGRVTDKDGRPISGAAIWPGLLGARTSPPGATTDRDGRFTLPHVDAADTWIVVTHSDFCAVEIGVMASDDTVQVQLRKAAPQPARRITL